MVGFHRLMVSARSNWGWIVCRPAFSQIQPDELILATNPTVEGEATAHFISRMIAGDVKQISRIAHGVPLGGEIEYTDGGTLTHALQGRRNVSLLD
jgi:recombinational DNA repair protein RecR